MDEIRSSGFDNIENLLDLDMYCDPKDAEEDIDNIISSSAEIITREEAKAILAVCMCNQVYGKETALNAFDTLVKRIISKNSEIEALGKISFLAGILYPNGVVSKTESDELGKKYTEAIMEKLKNTLN